MFGHIGTAVLLLAITTAIHGVAAALVIRRLRAMRVGEHVLALWSEVLLVATVVLVMFFATLLEVAVWAGVYLALGALDGPEPAFYFSMVTFTTLGYGDVTLGPAWRVLASFQAANGAIMFGWTTAVVVALLQRLTAAHARREE